ncbi:hypothetical protein RV11_GL000620 [Enterococcus phoeniculicola]|uniref:N-acetyltransferase domain-containing protein n=1 Tax=Enterococcus phoeniculicola ATCC BAA-412 TaxID=1158610 RepID=R3TNQ7_9ENTE|nr:GNAT family N-acetyltransferase [Enterococcus phoeniculicola]EOL43164.1 hypothetical protein UC3_02141 [Enterococcus phoeniculicola ATCC BAA-412]EOT76478.1 hypothetical protein I589_01435 [Enterococcus phoeniculicola ATCC BAA-412]OJG71095.1 hypothetical protein RV11_GL000620 [Enterococcus phoeniculicola]
MMTQLEWRKCTTKDIDALRTLSIETFTDTFADQNTAEDLAAYLDTAYNYEQLREELKNEESFFFFLQANKEIVGYLKLNIGQAQTETIYPDSLEVERIYIRSIHKRKGYGSEGITKAIQTAKALQKKSLWLGVWEKNERALAFYKNQGFTKVGSHSFFMGEDEQTDFILLKDL